jgi:thymidylate kinase
VFSQDGHPRDRCGDSSVFRVGNPARVPGPRAHYHSGIADHANVRRRELLGDRELFGCERARLFETVTGVACESDHARPYLLELVGPSGAGKTTVLEALLVRDDRIERKPTLRNAQYGIVARAVAAAVATLARRRALGRDVTLEQVLIMAYVQAVPRLLERGRLANTQVIAFDQGPIYFVSRPSLMDDRLAPWRERVLDTWASLLDLVVWLDAPDEVLTARINSRSKSHRLKGTSDETAVEALMTSRRVYENAISTLRKGREGPMILRFDTERRPASEIADVVLSAVADTARVAVPERGPRSAL